MSKAEKSQEIAKQAGDAAKKAGKAIGAGLSKFSKKMVAGAKGFKEGMKDTEQPPVDPKTEDVSVEDGQSEEVEEVKTTTIEADYSLDEE